jgi:3'-phosphoadenosine 5'-phosphosulfate sulfotransferase (PAPS reductase)/FAD synthetase
MEHLVGLSGGKDSTVMSLRLKELYPNTKFKFFCTPTGDELPEMETHWKKIEGLLGQKIIRLHHPDYQTLYDLIDHFKALPNYKQRWCTRIIKIETAQIFYNQFKDATIYVGLRADEQQRQGNRGVFDNNVIQRFPLQEWGWGLPEVLGYLKSKKITIPRRTDCGMCFYQRIGEWWLLWHEYPSLFKRYADMEVKLGHTLMAPGKHKIWPHDLTSLSVEFAKGRKPREIKHTKNTNTNMVQCRVCSL